MHNDRYSIQIMGMHSSLSASWVRRLLRLGFLTGTELVRRESPGAQWTRLHDTTVFQESVAHLGDPAVVAHRRRSWWWWPTALPLMTWLTFFSILMVVEPPPGDEVLPIVAILGGGPFAVLMLWSRRFRESCRVVRDARQQTADHKAVASPVEAPRVEDPLQEDREKLRADLEVVQRLRTSAQDPDRISALKREEQALLNRMIRN